MNIAARAGHSVARAWHQVQMPEPVRRGIEAVPGAIATAAVVVFFGWVLFAAADDAPEIAGRLGWYTPESVAAHYKVAKGYVEAKPHDCEFNSVPYGDKHCHYKARADVHRAESYAVIYWDKVED